MTIRSLSRRRQSIGGPLLAVVALLMAVATIVPAVPAEAQGTVDVIEITGRGWGHGRGLGQYGAYGYAARGWSSTQILDHYYGGTTAGQVPAGAPVDPAHVRVELRYMRGRSTTVALVDGVIVLRGADGGELYRVSGAARLRWDGGGFKLETASACGGSFSEVGRIDGRTEVRITSEAAAAGSNGLLQVCGPSYRTWYEGEIRAFADNGYPRTLNVVPIATYLRGVVPNEMPAGWPDAALQSQAVAARSYALAGDTRQQPYGDTCDSTTCQVYDGAFTERGGRFRSATHPRTDAAISATAGSVRLRGNGTIARTEFSSSTGGHTAGGDFPAVADEGDSITANPNHTWTVTVALARIESRYNRGRLLEMAVVERNGLGADGGRVVRVELRFERGTVTESGDAVRIQLGLKSNWFTPGPVGAEAKRSTAEGEYIDRTYELLAGRTASAAEINRWFDPVSRGERRGLTDSLVRGDHFVGELVDALYQSALGRGPDPDGRAYWIGEIADGLKLDSAGVLFYGSEEYYRRSGGTDALFVTSLYQEILHRSPDAEGQQYWESRLADGSARFDDVAAGFYSSLESRRSRATALHQRLLGSAPGPTERDASADRLLRVDDVVLASEIASSSAAYDA